jgi:Flp pilus assembly secretin CpaC
MEIHPKRSDGVVDSVTGLPSETTSEVTTNIMVKNGDTIVIGGLIETRDTYSVSQVPILGDLPVIGWLFRKEETGTRRVEIIVMITPRIVDPAVPEEGAEDMLADYEKRKKAFRSGFKFYTRTVRGERHVEAARRAIEQEKVSLADFHLGWAQRVDPHNKDINVLIAELDEIKGRRQSEDSSLEEYIWSQIK